MLPADTTDETTAVAVGIAKLGEPAVVHVASKHGGGFVASGRASSVAAGRLSYAYGLKAGFHPLTCLPCIQRSAHHAGFKCLLLVSIKVMFE